MSSKSHRKKKESALGKGLDALIRKDYFDEEDKVEKKIDSTLDEISKPSLNDDSSEKSRLDSESSHIDDEKVIQDVLLEVSKNPRISLWSAKSAAVLRFLKKTKPEFSISNEASLLIEEAVKNRYPDIWKIFEEEKL